MNKFSLKPDESMAWIYDCYHPEYASEYAESLRKRRAYALSQCPAWMKDQARMNDMDAAAVYD